MKPIKGAVEGLAVLGRMGAEIVAPVLGSAHDYGAAFNQATAGRAEKPMMQEETDGPGLEVALEGTNYLYHVELWTEPPSACAPTAEQIAERLAELTLKRATPEGRAELARAIRDQAASQIIDHMQAIPVTKAQLHDLIDDVYLRCQAGAHRVVFTFERLYDEDDRGSVGD